MNTELFADYPAISGAATALRALSTRLGGVVDAVQPVAQPATGSRQVDVELADFTGDALRAVQSLEAVLAKLADGCDQTVHALRTVDQRLSDQAARGAG